MRRVVHLLASLAIVLNALLGSGAAVVCFEPDQVAKVEWTLGTDCCTKPVSGTASTSVPVMKAVEGDHGCGPCTDVPLTVSADRAHNGAAPFMLPLAWSTWEIPPTATDSSAPAMCAASSLVAAPLPRVERPFVLRS